jgi:hypothetical protein
MFCRLHLPISTVPVPGYSREQCSLIREIDPPSPYRYSCYDSQSAASPDRYGVCSYGNQIDGRTYIDPTNFVLFEIFN